VCVCAYRRTIFTSFHTNQSITSCLNFDWLDFSVLVCWWFKIPTVTITCVDKVDKKVRLLKLQETSKWHLMKIQKKEIRNKIEWWVWLRFCVWARDECEERDVNKDWLWVQKKNAWLIYHFGASSMDKCVLALCSHNNCNY
jgi:hypothetical protein